MKFTIYQESRPGKRANNEDRLAHCYSRDALLLVIADGMGGHAGGGTASRIAVETIDQEMRASSRTTLPIGHMQATHDFIYCVVEKWLLTRAITRAFSC